MSAAALLQSQGGAHRPRQRLTKVRTRVVARPGGPEQRQGGELTRVRLRGRDRALRSGPGDQRAMRHAGQRAVLVVGDRQRERAGSARAGHILGHVRCLAALTDADDKAAAEVDARPVDRRRGRHGQTAREAGADGGQVLAVHGGVVAGAAGGVEHEARAGGARFGGRRLEGRGVRRHGGDDLRLLAYLLAHRRHGIVSLSRTRLARQRARQAGDGPRALHPIATVTDACRSRGRTGAPRPQAA